MGAIVVLVARILNKHQDRNLGRTVLIVLNCHLYTCHSGENEGA